MKRHPLSSLKADVTDLDPFKWANESYEISENFVYKGVKDSEAVPSGYTDEAVSLAEERIVTAGHRLANLMKKLNFGQSEKSLFLQ
jgi:hypothetical protein